MLFSKKIFLFLLFLTPLMSSAQLRNTPFSKTKNFISWQVGLAYPFFTVRNSDGENSTLYGQYNFLQKRINYGAQIGGSLAHYFGKNFHIEVGAGLLYSKYSSTEYKYNLISNPGREILEEHNGSLRYHHLSFFLPIDFNFGIAENTAFGIGVFALNPLLYKEQKEYTVTDYRYNPPTVSLPITDSFGNRRYDWRTGVHVQVSTRIDERDWQENNLLLEYYHSFSGGSFGSREKWFMVVYKHVIFY